MLLAQQVLLEEQLITYERFYPIRVGHNLSKNGQAVNHCLTSIIPMHLIAFELNNLL